MPIQKSNTAKGGPAGDLSRPERLAQRTRDADSSGEIGDVISDEYDFGAAGFENLDADEAESFARAIARLDDDGEIDNAPSEFSRIRVTDEDEDTNAMGDYFFNTSDDTTEMRIHRQNLDRERMNELISDGWQYGDPDDDALEQLFVHEWGHVRHHEALKSDEYLDLRSTLDRVNSYDPDMPDDVEQAARQDISDYSETNSWELVAETYTKRTLGSNDHSDRINEFYDEMFGPEPGDLGDAGDRLAVTDNTLRRKRGTMSDDEDLPSELADSADSVSETFETLAENADDADE